MKKTLIDPVPGGVSVADVTERLMLEFGAVLPLADVSRAVLQSFRDLAAAPVGALPELVERLARQLLHEAAVAKGEVEQVCLIDDQQPPLSEGEEIGHDGACGGVTPVRNNPA
jgi:hypothetical protein